MLNRSNPLKEIQEFSFRTIISNDQGERNLDGVKDWELAPQAAVKENLNLNVKVAQTANALPCPLFSALGERRLRQRVHWRFAYTTNTITASSAASLIKILPHFKPPRAGKSFD